MTAVLLKAIEDSGQSLYSIAKATGMQKTALGRFVARKQSLRLDIADRLAAHFGPAVTEPVRLHVAAKRYLCAAEPDYFGKLSSDSVRSLDLQGGPMSADEVEAFRKLPFHAEAVRLRRYDEAAKDPRASTPNFDHFLRHVEACRK